MHSISKLMKGIITVIVLLSTLITYSQNMVYFDRQSPYSDFTTGNGVVSLEQVGVSPTIQLLVKYKQLTGGVPTSTGWINHTGATYTDVYDDTIRAVGVYQGDTLIRTKHLFDANNYEVIDASASGFDEHGLYSMTLGNPWEIVVTFDGPTSNSDAELTSVFGFGSVTSVNNVITANQNNFMTGAIDGPIKFNGGKSIVSVNTISANYAPYNNTNNALLNAYIPRVNSRPNTVNDCGGEVEFERVGLVNDVSLEYSINGSSYAPLTSDIFSGLCAYDTISVLGFSPTIMPSDTLVRSQYVLRSADSLGQYDYDLSEVVVDLNLNNTNTTGCSNTLTFSHIQGSTNDGYGYLINEFGEVLSITFDPNFNEYASICQAQYVYTGMYMGNSLSAQVVLPMSDYVTMTIVDQNNEVHGIPVNSNIDQVYTDSLNCTSDVIIDRTTSPEYTFSASYTQFVSNSPGTYEEDNNIQSLGNYSDSLVTSGICAGMYSFQESDRKKFVFVTDSLQQLDVTYNLLAGDGSNGYMSVPTIDTLKLYYEECNNNYSQPFNTVNTHKTNSQVSTVNIFNTGFNVEEFNMSFDLTQGGSSFYLHERPVSMIDYSSYPNPTPYYTVVELFCQSPIKTTLKRRRIIIAPDGTITQEYEGNASVDVLSKSPDTQIYPNPASSFISIESSENWTSYEIIDSKGSLYLTGNDTSTINIESLRKGVYFVKLVNNESSITKKIIIE